MEPPVITRRRRPFLAPFWVMWLLFLLLLAAAFVAYRAATTTTVVLLRHAENELVTIEDPPLSAAGERRAERLAQMFDVRGPGRVAGIYVMPTRRAQQTAMPLAMRLGKKASVLPAPVDLDEVASHVLSEHRGGRVMIVGQSDTVVQLVQRLSGASVPPIGEDEYDNIYVVTVPTFGKASVLRFKY
jgi:2,3-bisphosphoglycerate-dependent phosphoglycerate mutase